MVRTKIQARNQRPKNGAKTNTRIAKAYDLEEDIEKKPVIEIEEEKEDSQNCSDGGNPTQKLKEKDETSSSEEEEKYDEDNNSGSSSKSETNHEGDDGDNDNDEKNENKGNKDDDDDDDGEKNEDENENKGKRRDDNDNDYDDDDDEKNEDGNENKGKGRAKSGVDPSDCVALVKHVKLHCPNLEFSGLMTIGMPDYSSTPENFMTLRNCRVEVCKVLGIDHEHCELSMGMSGDFEQAIEMGSTNVRIGSTIFGPRVYPKKQ